MAWAARSGQGYHTASLRWFTPRLDGPGAEPPEKDFKTLMTSSSKVVAGVGTGVEGSGLGVLGQCHPTPLKRYLQDLLKSEP